MSSSIFSLRLLHYCISFLRLVLARPISATVSDVKRLLDATKEVPTNETSRKNTKNTPQIVWWTCVIPDLKKKT